MKCFENIGFMPNLGKKVYWPIILCRKKNQYKDQHLALLANNLELNFIKRFFLQSDKSQIECCKKLPYAIIWFSIKLHFQKIVVQSIDATS